MTHQEYTYPVADASLTHADAVLAIDEVMNRLGFHSDGRFVQSPEFQPVHAALDALYAAMETARPATFADPLAEAVAIVREAAASAGVLEEFDEDADETEADNSDDED